MSNNSHSSFVKINQKMGKWEKKLFNLSAIIITSLYRVITLMTLRHCYVIMSHIQGVSYYATFFYQNTIFLKIGDSKKKSKILNKMLLNVKMTHENDSYTIFKSST